MLRAARTSTFGFVLSWTAASVLAVGPEAFAQAHRLTAVAPSPECQGT